MSATLPTELDPWQAVARGLVLAGSLPLTDLPRLSGTFAREAPDGVAWATFAIAFQRDEGGRPVVLGSVCAVLPLECQRCLGVVEHRVEAPVRLVLTEGPDLMQDPPEPYEALPVMDGLVRPAVLIEDELLLALPLFPMHASGLCRTDRPSQARAGRGVGDASPEAAPERPNPFAVLAGWKSQSRNQT